MNEERDSQLSAMIDGELPAAECELLARRLGKDELLRTQWSRYALIGAALRAERGVVLHDRVSWRVQSVIAQEAVYQEPAGESYSDEASQTLPAAANGVVGRRGTARWMRFAQPIMGAGIAAGVALVSIVWLRSQDSSVDPGTILASNSPEVIEAAAPLEVLASSVETSIDSTTIETVSNGEPDRYVTPQVATSSGVAPPARLANYVVAHSEFSGPLSRRMALLGLVTTESSTVSDELARELSQQTPVQPASAVNGQ